VAQYGVFLDNQDADRTIQQYLQTAAVDWATYMGSSDGSCWFRFEVTILGERKTFDNSGAALDQGTLYTHMTTPGSERFWFNYNLSNHATPNGYSCYLGVTNTTCAGTATLRTGNRETVVVSMQDTNPGFAGSRNFTVKIKDSVGNDIAQTVSGYYSGGNPWWKRSGNTHIGHNGANTPWMTFSHIKVWNAYHGTGYLSDAEMDAMTGTGFVSIADLPVARQSEVFAGWDFNEGDPATAGAEVSGSGFPDMDLDAVSGSLPEWEIWGVPPTLWTAQQSKTEHVGLIIPNRCAAGSGAGLAGVTVDSDHPETNLLEPGCAHFALESTPIGSTASVTATAVLDASDSFPIAAIAATCIDFGTDDLDLCEWWWQTTAGTDGTQTGSAELVVAPGAVDEDYQGAEGWSLGLSLERALQLQSTGRLCRSWWFRDDAYAFASRYYFLNRYARAILDRNAATLTRPFRVGSLIAGGAWHPHVNPREGELDLSYHETASGYGYRQVKWIARTHEAERRLLLEVLSAGPGGYWSFFSMFPADPIRRHSHAFPCIVEIDGLTLAALESPGDASSLGWEVQVTVTEAHGFDPRG